MRTAVSVALLVAVLGFAVARPRRLPEAVLAVPAAAVAVLAGLVPARDAWRELGALGPTVGFLAAVLVLAYLADGHGVFRYAGAVTARLGRRGPVGLLGAVFAVAAAVTALLSLDATVVLLTPVVFAVTARAGVRPRPHLYACTHLANSASLLLPVSNLTNLLAFAATGLTFASFTGLMALPWLVVIGVEYVAFRWFFAADLGVPAHPVPTVDVRAPRYALAVLAGTLAGFVVAGPLGVPPVWVAAAGAVALAVPRLRGGARGAGRILLATNPAFCLFVLALGVVVAGVRRYGLGTAVAAVVPDGTGLPALLLIAVLAAVLANLVNNLPATLVLVPVVGQAPGPVLAVLIGVNVGPNLTYVGSLATLLWRRVLHARGAAPAAAEFLRLGALTVPAGLVAGVAALWLVLRVSGVS